MSRSQTVRSPWAGRDREAERTEKREAVLQAAARAFAERGYHQTSLDDIATMLGVTKPTLYYYARSKDDLIAATCSRALANIMETVEPDQDAIAIIRLRNMLHRYAAIMTTDFGRCISVMRDARIGGDAGDAVLDGMRRIDRRIRELLVHGMDDASIAPCDPRITSFVIAGAINGIARWYSDDGPLTSDEVAAAVVGKLVDALAPR